MVFSSEKQNIKILHAGDLHLDSPFSRLDPRRGEEARRALRASFSRMMDYLRREEIDLCLLAGDLFDSEYVTSRTASLLIDELAGTPGTTFVIAPGNHDPYTPSSFYASGRLPDNVLIFSSEDLSSFVLPALNTVVWGYAFTSERMGHCPLAGKRIEDPDRLNLLCIHGDLGTPLSPYSPITKEDLASFGADYAALSHKHVPFGSAPGERPVYAYSGCLVGRSFDEPGIGGAVLITARRGETGYSLTTERIPFADRRYESVTVDLTAVSSEKEVARRIKAAVTEHGFGAETSLRVTFTGATPPDFAPPKSADGPVLGLAYLELIDRTSPTFDARALEHDMTVRGELYRSLLPRLSSGTPEERAIAARALRMGLAALAGEDVTHL